MRRHVFFVAVVVVMVALAPRAAASEASIRVTPQVATEGSTVLIIVRVTPEPSLRGMTVEADSPEFFRSSSFELPGRRSAAVHTIELRSLPAGSYAVRVVIDRVAVGDASEAVDATLRAKFRILG